MVVNDSSIVLSYPGAERNWRTRSYILGIKSGGVAIHLVYIIPNRREILALGVFQGCLTGRSRCFVSLNIQLLVLLERDCSFLECVKQSC